MRPPISTWHLVSIATPSVASDPQCNLSPLSPMCRTWGQRERGQSRAGSCSDLILSLRHTSALLRLMVFDLWWQHPKRVVARSNRKCQSSNSCRCMYVKASLAASFRSTEPSSFPCRRCAANDADERRTYRDRPAADLATEPTRRAAAAHSFEVQLSRCRLARSGGWWRAKHSGRCEPAAGESGMIQRRSQVERRHRAKGSQFVAKEHRC